MGSRNDSTLSEIKEKPTRADIRWSDIMSLLKSLGAEISEAEGSRVRVALKERRMVLHRPHPKPVAKKYQVEAIRQLLESTGVVK